MKPIVQIALMVSVTTIVHKIINEISLSKWNKK